MFAGKKKEFYYLFFSLAMLLLIPSMFFADTASSSNYVTNYEIQSSGSQGQFSSSSYNITASGGVMGGSMNSTNYGITSGILAGSVETTTTTVAPQSPASDGGGGGSGGGGASGSMCYQAGSDNKVSGVSLLQNRFTCFSGFKNTSISLLNMSLSKSVVQAEFAATDIGTNKLPPGVQRPEEKTYKFLEVSKSKIPEDIEMILKIRFSVSREWLTSNNLNESKVTLRIFKDDIWKILPTQKISGYGDNFFFESESPHTGIFAVTEILEKQMIEAVTTTTTTTMTTTTTSPPFLTKIISKFTAPEFEGFTIAFSIFFIVLVFVLIFGL